MGKYTTLRQQKKSQAGGMVIQPPILIIVNYLPLKGEACSSRFRAYAPLGYKPQIGDTIG